MVEDNVCWFGCLAGRRRPLELPVSSALYSRPAQHVLQQEGLPTLPAARLLQLLHPLLRPVGRHAGRGAGRRQGHRRLSVLRHTGADVSDGGRQRPGE